MRKTAFSIIIASAAAFGCSSSSNSGGNASAFAGTYACTTTTNLHFTAPAGTPDNNTTSSSTDTIVANADGTISGTSTNDAGSPCNVKFTTSGNSATLVSGQSCTTGSLTITYTSGSASLNGSNLTANLNFSFMGTAGPMMTAFTGTGSQATSCTKM